LHDDLSYPQPMHKSTYFAEVMLEHCYYCGAQLTIGSIR
jgi:hypothetical protein